MPWDAPNEHSNSGGEAERAFCWPAELTAHIVLRARSHHYEERHSAFFSAYRVVERQRGMDFSLITDVRSLSPSAAMGAPSGPRWAGLSGSTSICTVRIFRPRFLGGPRCPLLPGHTRLPAHPGGGPSLPPPPGSLPCPHGRAPRPQGSTAASPAPGPPLPKEEASGVPALGTPLTGTRPASPVSCPPSWAPPAAQPACPVCSRRLPTSSVTPVPLPAPHRPGPRPGAVLGT